MEKLIRQAINRGSGDDCQARNAIYEAARRALNKGSENLHPERLEIAVQDLEIAIERIEREYSNPNDKEIIKSTVLQNEAILSDPLESLESSLAKQDRSSSTMSMIMGIAFGSILLAGIGYYFVQTDAEETSFDTTAKNQQTNNRNDSRAVELTNLMDITLPTDLGSLSQKLNRDVPLQTKPSKTVGRIDKNTIIYTKEVIPIDEKEVYKLSIRFSAIDPEAKSNGYPVLSAGFVLLDKNKKVLPKSDRPVRYFAHKGEIDPADIIIKNGDWTIERLFSLELETVNTSVLAKFAKAVLKLDFGTNTSPIVLKSLSVNKVD